MAVEERVPPATDAPAAEAATGWARLKERPNLIRVVAVILFFIFWEFAGREGNELFMSYPSAIVRAAWIITADGTLIEAFRASMVPFAIGMAISIVGGIAFGVVMARVWLFEYIVDPYVNALYAIPRIALVPLITLVAGLQLGGKITIIVSIAIFPVIINTYAGMKDVRGSLLEIGTPSAPASGRSSSRSCCPTRCRSSWLGSAWRSAWQSSAWSSPSCLPPSPGSAA